jgi:hypothetical protein
MKYICLLLSGLPLFFSCNSKNDRIVDQHYVDSVLANYSPSLQQMTNEQNLLFWKNKMQTRPEDFVNGPEYGSALLVNFKSKGNINDLVRSDSLLHRTHEGYSQKEPNVLRALTYYAVLQHQFVQADSLLQEAQKIDGISNPGNLFTEFDVCFERGNYARAKTILALLKKDRSYPYLFRLSKYEHYEGSFDSAAFHMMAAASIAQSSFLKQTALSNAGDLYLHNGDCRKAYSAYMDCLKINPSDFHSLGKIAVIALLHDKKIELAKRILDLITANNASPEYILLKEQIAEAEHNRASQAMLSKIFESETANPPYGLMYSKYLIDLYTGILAQPSKAVALAEKEISNRATPQTYCWYAWALLCHGDTAKAFQTYQSFVSKKPLEALELYYMGRLMQSLNKRYNAQQFFSAAYKNRFDLSPEKIAYLKENLE